MPKEGFVSVTLREHIYKLAKEKAEQDGIKVAQLVEKAIQMYIDSRLRLEEKGRIIAKILEQLERGEIKL